jgi:hypothetical protein
MSNPSAYILVHPGSLVAHAGLAALDAAVEELEAHFGPIIIIDGFLSDLTAPRDEKIMRALQAADARGHLALRVWGCDSGEEPFDRYFPFIQSGIDLPYAFYGQEEAAAAIATHLNVLEIELSGAWATDDDSSGCVNSVATAIKNTGWNGTASIRASALFEDRD